MRILITAGPTREHIDPVRYLSNHSTGKMGYALAASAVERGHQVTLVSGPVNLVPPEPAVAQFIPVESALDMQAAVNGAATAVDAIIMCAAVADFRVAQPDARKLKKDQLLAHGATTWTLELIPNPDILAGLRDIAPRATIVGFAAETDAHLENARKKLAAKRCDILALNDVSRTDIGFGAEQNEVTLLFADGRMLHLDRADKREIAATLMEQIENLRPASASRR